MNSLQNITYIIKKCCSVEEAIVDYTDRYKFRLDISKLENMLKQKKTNLHVLAFDKSLQSKLVGVEDIQLVSEYMHDPDLLELTIGENSNTNFVQFMIFGTENQDGKIDIKITNPEPGEEEIIDDKELFGMVNGINGHELDRTLVTNIVKFLPCYRVIVTRIFNTSEDRFEYRVYIRSNYNMVTYYKSVKEAQQKK